MSFNPKMRPADVYPVAIRAEIDAAEIYRGLLEKIRNEALREKLTFLAREEDRHKGILERLFKDHFPGLTLIVPAVSARPKKSVPVDEATTVPEIFRLAMAKEKEAEDYYRGAKALAEDAQSRRILDYLARAERSHYYMLRSEIDLLERFPDYYDVAAEHEGQELFHIGA